MTNFENYTKPIQIQKIEDLIFLIGFNRKKQPTYWTGIFNYTYDNWVIIIEHKKHDSVSENISFELFYNKFIFQNITYTQENYTKFDKRLTHFNDKNKYEKDFDDFSIKCISLLKEIFCRELRKTKIEKLLQ